MKLIASSIGATHPSKAIYKHGVLSDDIKDELRFVFAKIPTFCLGGVPYEDYFN